MSTPLSIVVPLLNEAERLPALLAQLQLFRQRDCEVILVDGGSQDATVALVQPSGLTCCTHRVDAPGR